MPTTEIASIVLCAGEGRRLRPITERLPKSLCTVGNTSLLRWALDSPAARGRRQAINAHHLAGQVVEHVRDLGVEVSQSRRPWHSAQPERSHSCRGGWAARTPSSRTPMPGSPTHRRTSSRAGTAPGPVCSCAARRGPATSDRSGSWGCSLLPRSERRTTATRADRSLRGGLARRVGARRARPRRAPGPPHSTWGRRERLLAANLVAGDGTSFVHPSARVTARLHCCVALPGAVVAEPLSYCVLGPGDMRVCCDEQVVAEEMAIGRGNH